MTKTRILAGLALMLPFAVMVVPGYASACDLPGDLRLEQSTNIPVDMDITTNGTKFSGTIRWRSGSNRDSGRITEGFFDGKVFSFTAKWKRSPVARYTGGITGDGAIRGDVSWGTGNSAAFWTQNVCN